MIMDSIINKIITEHTMKFDVVIGNPPFQEIKSDGNRKDKASNLWSKFWSIAIKDLSKDDGVIGLITPTTWISPSRDLVGKFMIDNKNRLWDIFDQYSSYADVINVKQYFPGIGSSFGYVIVDKSSSNGLVFSDGSDTSIGFLPKGNICEIKKELSLTNNLTSLFVINQSNIPNLRVTIPVTRVLTKDSFEILQGNENPTKGSHKDYGLYLYVYPSTMDEAIAIKERLISILPLLNTSFKFSGWLNIKMVKNISYKGIK